MIKILFNIRKKKKCNNIHLAHLKLNIILKYILNKLEVMMNRIILNSLIKNTNNHKIKIYKIKIHKHNNKSGLNN